MSLEYSDIRFLCVSPDLIMVSVSDVMLEQVRAILKIDYDGARNKQLLGYDTQFNLGKSLLIKILRVGCRQKLASYLAWIWLSLALVKPNNFNFVVGHNIPMSGLWISGNSERSPRFTS